MSSPFRLPGRVVLRLIAATVVVAALAAPAPATALEGYSTLVKSTKPELYWRLGEAPGAAVKNLYTAGSAG